MTRARRALLHALPFAALGVLACSSTSKGTAGNDAGTGGAASGETAGGQCGRVISAYCHRAIDGCGNTSSTVDACVSDGTTACCGDRCNDKATSSTASVDTCVSAMNALTCDEVTAGTIPSSCNKVVTVTSVVPVVRPGGFGAALLGEE